MVAHCPPTLAGLRDRALLLLGYRGAFRRSDLAVLDVADPEEHADGLQVPVHRARTDREGVGAPVPVWRGDHACPVAAERGRPLARSESQRPHRTDRPTCATFRQRTRPATTERRRSCGVPGAETRSLVMVRPSEERVTRSTKMLSRPVRSRCV